MEELRAHATSDGWRGILADEITAPFVRRVAATLAARTPPGLFLVSHDTRFLASYLAHEMASEIVAFGHCCVLSDRATPTPVLAWSTVQRGAAWGLQVTASHNPPEYSGVKVRSRQGCAPPAAMLADLISGPPPSARERLGVVAVEDLWEPYAQTVRERFNWSRIGAAFPKVVIDAMHGTTAGLLRRIVGDRLEVIGVREAQDPLFGGVAPEPKAQSLEPLRRAVEESGAPIGFAHDGDGDRITAWAPDVGCLSPQDLLTLFVWDACVRGLPGAFVVSVTTTDRVRRLAERFGRDVFEVDIGFHNAAEIMLRTPVAVAGEENGGVAFGDHLADRDGTYAVVRLLDALTEHGLSVAEALRDVHAHIGPSASVRHDLPVIGVRTDFAEILATTFGLPLERVQHIRNGAKARLPSGGWVVVRLAGTEPLLRIYAEAASLADADKLASQVAEEIETDGLHR